MDFKALAALSYVVARELSALRDPECWVSVEGANSGQRKLCTADGDNLTITVDGGRITIRAWLPETAMPGTKRHAINVSDERTAEAIAKEISRRLLPAYRAELAEVLGYNARCIAQHHGRAAVLAELAQALGGTYRTPDYSLRRDQQVLHMAYMPVSVGGSITVTGEPSTVDMSLSNVPADKARRMLAILAGTDSVPELAYSGTSQRGDTYATAEDFVAYLAGVMQADNGLDDYSGQADGETLVVLAHDIPVYRAEFRCAIDGCTEHENCERKGEQR